MDATGGALHLCHIIWGQRVGRDNGRSRFGLLQAQTGPEGAGVQSGLAAAWQNDMLG